MLWPLLLESLAQGFTGETNNLSFGPSAKVVAPERLRRRVESELARALDNYRTEVIVLPPKPAKKAEAKPAVKKAGVKPKAEKSATKKPARTAKPKPKA